MNKVFSITLNITIHTCDLSTLIFASEIYPVLSCKLLAQVGFHNYMNTSKHSNQQGCACVYALPVNNFVTLINVIAITDIGHWTSCAFLSSHQKTKNHNQQHITILVTHFVIVLQINFLSICSVTLNMFYIVKFDTF